MGKFLTSHVFRPWEHYFALPQIDAPCPNFETHKEAGDALDVLFIIRQEYYIPPVVKKRWVLLVDPWAILEALTGTKQKTRQEKGGAHKEEKRFCYQP